MIGLTYFIYDMRSQPKIEFLEKEDTARFLYHDKDRYITSMSHLDLHARHVKFHSSYLKIAKDAALSFSEEQKDLLEKCIQNAEYYLKYIAKHPLLNNTYFHNFYWKIAYVDSTYENGLPHTRKDIIFLSTKTMEQSPKNITITLIHEAIHIYQRFRKTEFQELLLKHKYEIWRLREGYPRIRANPDLDEYIYIHPSGKVMVSIYNSNKPTSISDVISPYEYAYEHPNEEIAHEVADAYLKNKT